MEELQDVIFCKHVSLLETSISLIFLGMSHSFACHEVGSSGRVWPMTQPSHDELATVPCLDIETCGQFILADKASVVREQP